MIDEGIRVGGEILDVSDHGKVGSRVASRAPWVYWIKDFHIQPLPEDKKLWVAIRTNGSGGADALDNIRIVARPLPVKPSTPAPAP